MPSGTLEVTIVSARNLKLMDGGVSNDPYIQIRLGPQKFKTEVKLKAGREATWNQTFYLGLIEKFTELTLEVYDQDRMIDDTIGKTTIPLEGLLDQGETDSWFTVGKGSNATGEVHARILFKPVTIFQIVLLTTFDRVTFPRDLILRLLTGNPMPR
ncbi:hypothetical protein DSO57_1031385 [Entomophthora muscae]|uniref:Uncharacterized protein n=1 Tax=Entomophthora muscae TaxID=34485 RepID=A0ACC2TBG9_9FUNG|nr:hypothetical protein DSO57_1031385 [Entomophthora muscae]